MTKQQQLDRIARRLQYATGQQIEVTEATPVTNQFNEPVSTKVEKLDQQERYCASRQAADELNMYMYIDEMIANYTK